MKNEKILHRVVTFLNREELDFIDDISKDIFFSQKLKVPRSTVLKTIIDILLKERGEKTNYEEMISQIVNQLQNKEGKS